MQRDTILKMIIIKYVTYLWARKNSGRGVGEDAPLLDTKLGGSDHPVPISLILYTYIQFLSRKHKLCCHTKYN